VLPAHLGEVKEDEEDVVKYHGHYGVLDEGVLDE
jgi:hypothetical protein